MLQTDRKTEAARQTSQDREQTRQHRQQDDRTQAALALQAILNGGSWEQLPAEGMLALSGIMGNDALTSVLMLRETGPETGVSVLPAGPCMTAPGEWGGGEPITSDAPDFAAFSPLGGAAPLAL